MELGANFIADVTQYWPILARLYRGITFAW